jgi:hypothetical protein
MSPNTSPKMSLKLPPRRRSRHPEATGLAVDAGVAELVVGRRFSPSLSTS